MAFLSKVLSHVNILAVIASGVAFWILGALWFGLLFGKIWSSELEKLGMKINPGGMAAKSIYTLVLELLVAFGCAVLIWLIGIETVPQAIRLGLGVGIFLAAFPMMIAYGWESRPMKLVLIDVLYPVLGITICMVILTLWK